MLFLADRDKPGQKFLYVRDTGPMPVGHCVPYGLGQMNEAASEGRFVCVLIGSEPIFRRPGCVVSRGA